MIKTAIIPAAGRGTRLYPISKTIPKPLLPLGRKPIIQHILEQLADSGIEEVVIVVRGPQDPVKLHFTKDSIEEELKRENETVLLQEFEDLWSRLSIHFVYQPEPKGTGDAILCAKEFINREEAVLTLFPDIFFGDSTPVAKQLIDQYKIVKSPIGVLCRFWSREELLGRAGVFIRPHQERLHIIERFVERPNLEDINTDLTQVGYYVVTADIISHLEALTPSIRGELEYPEALQKLAEQEGITFYGYELENPQFFDCGEPEGYEKAFIHMTKKYI